jgi:hypothetical protein
MMFVQRMQTPWAASLAALRMDAPQGAILHTRRAFATLTQGDTPPTLMSADNTGRDD